jgi:hypothetical protein
MGRSKKGTTPPEELYYLRDSRGDTGSSAMFWGITGSYKTSIRDSEKFTREKAIAQYQSRETDIPLRCDLIDPLAYLAIDHQYVKEHYDPDPDGLYVMQQTGSFDGNHIKFRCEDGSYSYDYSKADVCKLSPDQAKRTRLLPKSEMDKLARPVVMSSLIDTGAFLRKAKIKIIRVKKVRETSGKHRHNCPGCSKFVWDYNPYDAPLCKSCD